jgi:hypothetical protein
MQLIKIEASCLVVSNEFSHQGTGYYYFEDINDPVSVKINRNEYQK